MVTRGRRSSVVARSSLLAADVPLAPVAGDEALVARVRAGEVAAFETLFHGFYRPLGLYMLALTCSRAVAEDLMQDLFTSIWMRRSTWVVTGNLRSYLFAAARNRAMLHLRHQGVVQRVADAAQAEGAAPGMGHHRSDPAQLVQARETAQALEQAMAALPARCREAVTLRRDGGLSYAEIAATMGVSQKRVEALLTMAYKALRAPLAPHWPPSPR